MYIHKTGLFREMWKCRGFGNKRKTRSAETHQYLYINWKALSTYLFLCLQEKKGIYLRSSAFGHDQRRKRRMKAVKPAASSTARGSSQVALCRFMGSPGTGCAGSLVVNDWSGPESTTVLLQGLQECLDFCFVGDFVFSRKFNQEM